MTELGAQLLLRGADCEKSDLVGQLVTVYKRLNTLLVELFLSFTWAEESWRPEIGAGRTRVRALMHCATHIHIVMFFYSKTQNRPKYSEYIKCAETFFFTLQFLKFYFYNIF